MNVQKRIYAKLMPKIQAHDQVTEIGTCLKKQVPIFSYLRFFLPFPCGSCGHSVGAMLLSNVSENTFQIICNQASEIFIFSDLCHFQRPQMQVVFIAAVFHQCHLPNSFQNGVHVVDPHICDPVNVNLGVQHKPLEILVADQLRQQLVVELTRSQYFDCIITQM